MHKRTGGEIGWVEGRDQWMHEAMACERPFCAPEMMGGEEPLFLLYTSGSTGKPKGVLHSTAGYLLWTAFTHHYTFDHRPGDVYACVADVGWITGHSYIVYGPLCNAATTFMFEGLPTNPDPGRYWDMVQRHRITSFYTAPTAIRALMKFGTEHVKKYDKSSLRVLGSVGEPINPEAWRWYFEEVGEKRCVVVDTFWQTETGGHMITNLPGCTPMKPGAASLPMFGVRPVVVDPTSGEVLAGNGVEGVLCVSQPWPGIARTIYGDHGRYLETYLKPYGGKYFTGDPNPNPNPIPNPNPTPNPNPNQVLHGRRLQARPRRLLLDHRPRRRRAQRERPPARHCRDRVGPRPAPGLRRGGRSGGAARRQGPGGLRLRHSGGGCRGDGRPHPVAQDVRAQGDRRPRHP